ncbi:MAG TPA: CDP-alcohol phosphatidyltransferase family protein [Ktedonobacterales bacterium]|nr:CDP-alcohol phosphatidyltransferase family protein [Ktedonobacterales bacterium]
MADTIARGSGQHEDLPDFALDLLAELRASHYHPVGWVRFLGRSWRQSRATAQAHPRLVASWLRITAVLVVAEALALASEAARGHRAASRQAVSVAAGLLALQQLDAYVHLGMNNRQRESAPRDDLGLPNALTLARQSTAGLLWAHLLVRRPVSRGYLAAALLAASVTDVADGALARRLDRTSRLGQYLDGEADLSFALAVALTLGLRRDVPRWLVFLVLARWSVPFIYGLASYFGWISRVPISSTIVGKAAGVAQALTMGAALAPERSLPSLAPVRRALHLLTAGLLVAAPLTQWRKVRRMRV